MLQVGQVVGIEDVVAEVLPEETRPHINTAVSRQMCRMVSINDTQR